MPANIKLYNGTTDPEDHLSRFSSAANSGEWPMPVWCRMFQQTLDGSARGWFENLLQGSIDVRQQFTTRFSTRRACFKDPTEITKIVRKANETLAAFKERWIVEKGFITGVPEVMKISSFMDDHKCPELAKQYSDKVPKMVDEMMTRLDDFVRSEEAFANTELPKGEVTEGSDNRRRDAWNSGTKDGSRTGKKEERSPLGLLGDGEFCQRCTCMRCGSGLSKGLCLICASRYGNNPNPNSLNDSPNISENVSQSPPLIDHHCCYVCGDSLDGIFCQRCTCESCGKGAHYGYNCPSKVSIISNPEPCNSQTVDELPQTLPSFDPTCYSGEGNVLPYVSKPNFVDDSPNIFNPPSQPQTYSCEFCGNDAHYGYDCPSQFEPPQHPVFHQPPQETSMEILQDRENVINSVRTFLRKFNRYSFFETPKVLLLAWDRISEIKDAFGNKQYKPEDIQELFRKLLNDMKNIHEELSEYINSPSWNRPIIYFYDDDDEESSIPLSDIISELPSRIEITPILSTEEPYSVEDLVPIPSESEGIPDDMCDVPFRDNSPPLDISKDQFEDFSNSNDDCTSSDEDYSEDIDYVEASSLDSELVSLEEIKSLNDNPTPNCVLKSPSPFPIPIEDSDSFFEKSDTSLSYSDNSLPEFETFSYHTEEMSSGNTTTHADNSLPEYDSFLCKIEPDQEKNSGSITIYADISLLGLECFYFKSEPDPGNLTSIINLEIPTTHAIISQYGSSYFDLLINLFPPTDRSDFYHEEFADELAHIISPPDLECFYFKIEQIGRIFDEPQWDSIARIFEASRARSFVLRSQELHILSFILGIRYPNLID
ncbi:hypothetical protein Tco_0591243 [Tanacetum coccineum]